MPIVFEGGIDIGPGINVSNAGPTPSGTWAQISTLPTVVGTDWSLSYNDLNLYAIVNSAGYNGTATVYRSTGASLGYAGITWTTGASVTGSSSPYAATILALSATTLIVQQRAGFFRSTDGGASFTNILNATGSGQNNYFIPSSDGTYGICAGYSYNVITTNNWVTATKVSQFGTGTALATSALTNNGSNRFISAALGSSAPLNTYGWIVDTSGTVYKTQTVNGDQNFTCSDPATGRNAIVSAPESGPSFGVYHATYPGTTYTSSNVTGMGNVRTGQPCISPEGRVVVPMNNGVWKVYMDNSTAPELITSTNNIASVVSDGSMFCYALGSDGKVYRFTTG